jgi:hypothetical protein
MSVRQKQLNLIQNALKILEEHSSTFYTQAIICQKLDILGFGVSPSLFNKLIKKKRIGDGSLLKIQQGLTRLIELELGWVYNPSTDNYTRIENDTWQQELVVLPENTSKSIFKEPFFHFDGRRSIEEKVAFIQPSTKEIIFLGVRLRQLVSYFTNRKDADFKDHILNLMSKGVKINCYLADPDSNLTRAYFNDRALILPKEAFGDALIPQIIEDLQKIKNDLSQCGTKGEFRVYTYKHYPTTHFLAVDRNTIEGKLLVSNYVFGVPRSKIPVIEVYRQYTPNLFEMYNYSLDAMIRNAKEVL